MDNVKFHKSNEVAKFLEENGYILMFTPPYSPFLNPIENMLSKWKNYTRRAQPNNEAELMEAIRNGTALIASRDCEGFYRNMYKYIMRSLRKKIILD